MKLLGLEIRRPIVEEKATPPSSLAMLPNTRGRGWTTIFEPFAGAWQRNIELTRKDITSHNAVFACMTLIASDVSKLGAPEFKRLEEGVWKLDESPAYDPVLRAPNHYQTPGQFWESWILSKLWKGNTYALKGRDARRVVTKLSILDPCAVTPLLSTSGDIFYQVEQDNLSGVASSSVFPESEIIHDRFNCLWSPLVGIPPLYAAAISGSLGLNIMENASTFFANRSLPGGILTTPNTIPPETAQRLKTEWESRYGADGTNTGRTAVLGDGLEFKPITATAENSQMIELARATAEWVCSAFHVPPYKIGAAPTPSLANVQALNVEYYSQAVQKLLEDIEACLLRGLEMKAGTKVEFNIDGLLRMDTASQIVALKDAVGSSVMSPNEARAKLELPPVKGGESPLSQQQYYSLEALGKRDAQEDPFAPATPPAPPPTAGEDETGDEEDDDTGEQERQLAEFARGLAA
jgi:HK97 family phage portal protein